MLSQKHHVLCASGNEDISFILATLLEDRGHQVTTAASPNEALDLTQSRRFDLYVLDTPMPRMSAAELSEGIGRFHPDASILVFSSTPFEWDRLAAETSGVRGYVAQPDVTGLMRCVDGLLGEGRTAARAASSEGLSDVALPLAAPSRCFQTRQRPRARLSNSNREARPALMSG